MEEAASAVCSSPKKRAYRSVEERRRIVEETLVPGVSVAAVARAHSINANQVFGWRKLYRAGLLGPSDTSSEALQGAVRLLPVSIAAEPEPATTQPIPTATEAAIAPAGAIELMFATTRVRITGHVDTAALRMVLESLRA